MRSIEPFGALPTPLSPSWLRRAPPIRRAAGIVHFSVHRGLIATCRSEFRRCNRPLPALWAANDHRSGHQRQTGLNPVSNLSGYRDGRANRPAMRSKAHRVVVRCRATTFVAVACIGLVVAAHVGRDRRGGENMDDVSVMEETTGRIGDSQRATAQLALSEEDRGYLYEGIILIADSWVANAPAPTVADALPTGVPLHDLPAGVVQKIPQVEGQRFVKFEDRIVVVDPKSRVVVAMIPRYKLLP
jgi:hypothetical protein